MTVSLGRVGWMGCLKIKMARRHDGRFAMGAFRVGGCYGAPDGSGRIGDRLALRAIVRQARNHFRKRARDTAWTCASRHAHPEHASARPLRC